MPVTVDVQGGDRLIAKLGAMQAIAVLRPPMQRAQYRLQADISDYSNVRARRNSKYERTGTLGRSWTVSPIEEFPDGIEGKIGTNLRYAPFVQSKRFQAEIHRGRWHTDAMVMERQRRRILADFRRAITDALK